MRNPFTLIFINSYYIHAQNSKNLGNYNTNDHSNPPSPVTIMVCMRFYNNFKSSLESFFISSLY